MALTPEQIKAEALGPTAYAQLSPEAQIYRSTGSMPTGGLSQNQQPQAPQAVAPTASPAAPATQDFSKLPQLGGTGSQFGFSNVLQTAVDRLNTISPLLTQKNLLIKQLYDQPLSPGELKQLPPEIQQAIQQGDKSNLEMQLRLTNDQVAGRSNTLDQSINFLTSQYNKSIDDLESQRQKAIDNVISFATTYGAQAKSALASLYGPDYVNQLKQMGIDIDQFTSASTLAQQKLYDTSGGGGGGSLGVIGTTGSPQIDTSISGYSTKPVPGAGGLTQAAIDQAATQYALTGVMPAMGQGSTGSAGQKRTAIQNRAAEIGSGTNIATNKATLGALTKSLNEQTDYVNTTERALRSADTNFQQVIDAFTGSGLNPSQSTVANKSISWIRSHLTGGNQFAFDAGIQEVKNDYAIVFSRGGSVTDQARAAADKAINDKMSFADFKRVAAELKTLGQQVVNSGNTQISSINKQMNEILGGGTVKNSTYTGPYAPTYTGTRQQGYGGTTGNDPLGIL